MSKDLVSLEQEGNYDSFCDLGLEFEAFASDILEQLSGMSVERLLEAGVSVLKTDINDKNSSVNSIKFSFSYGETTFTLEKRKPNYTVPWMNEMIIGCFYPKDGNSFRFEISNKLVCSETITAFSTTRQHFNKSFKIKAGKGGREAVVARVSPLHCIERRDGDFKFRLRDDTSDKGILVRGALPEDELYEFTSYSGLPIASILGGTALDNMRAGWREAYKKLGLLPKPYEKSRLVKF